VKQVLFVTARDLRAVVNKGKHMLWKTRPFKNNNFETKKNMIAMFIFYCSNKELKLSKHIYTQLENKLSALLVELLLSNLKEKRKETRVRILVWFF